MSLQKTPQERNLVPQEKPSTLSRLTHKKSVLTTIIIAVITYGSRFFDWGMKLIDWLQRYDYIAGRDTRSYKLVAYLFSPRGSDLLFFLALVAFFIAVLLTINPKEPHQPATQSPSGGKSALEEKPTSATDGLVSAQTKRWPTTKVVEIEPNIVALDPEPCIAHNDQDGVIIEGEIKYYHGGTLWWTHDHFLAITVPYRNRLHESKEVGEIYGVSAQITYQFYDGQTKPYEMPRAAWLSEEESYVDFPRDATHRLIIATMEVTNNDQLHIYAVSRDSFGSRIGRETRQIELSGDLFGIQVSLRSETRGKVVKTSDYMLEIKREDFDCSLTPTLMWKRDNLAGFGLEATDLIKKHEEGAADKDIEKAFEDWETKVANFLIIHLGLEYKRRFFA
ncbi:MAG: hypothetical protein WCB68_02780 [Pyrinomonadaceae bacterium]